jgi:hypothetical protein
MSNEAEERVPREMRTPITDAAGALAIASDFWDWLIKDLTADNPSHDYGKIADPEYFFRGVLGDVFDDPETDGDKSVDEIGLSYDGTRDPDIAPFALLQVMLATVAYSVQAFKAEKGGRHEEAWTYAVDAIHWSGILNAVLAEKKYGENPAAVMARRRHVENYLLAADAITYWREKIDSTLSASKAANELINVVPLSHKKLAEIVAAEKKKKQP